MASIKAKQQNIVAMNGAQCQQQQQRVAIQCQSHISIMFYKWLQTDWRRFLYSLRPLTCSEYMLCFAPEYGSN